MLVFQTIVTEYNDVIGRLLNTSGEPFFFFQANKLKAGTISSKRANEPLPINAMTAMTSRLGKGSMTSQQI